MSFPPFFVRVPAFFYQCAECKGADELSSVLRARSGFFLPVRRIQGGLMSFPPFFVRVPSAGYDRKFSVFNRRISAVPLLRSPEIPGSDREFQGRAVCDAARQARFTRRAPMNQRKNSNPPSRSHSLRAAERPRRSHLPAPSDESGYGLRRLKGFHPLRIPHAHAGYPRARQSSARSFHLSDRSFPCPHHHPLPSISGAPPHTKTRPAPIYGRTGRVVCSSILIR